MGSLATETVVFEKICLELPPDLPLNSYDPSPLDAFVVEKIDGHVRRSRAAMPGKHAQMTPNIISSSDQIAS